jgi:DNA-binding CsgD family transcriptional regulator
LDAGLLAQALSADLLLIDARLGAQGPRAVSASATAVAGQARRLGLPALQAVAELYVAAAATWSGDDGVARGVLADAAGRPTATVEVTALGPAVLALGRVAAHDLDEAVALLDASLPALAEHGSAAPVPFWGLWALLRTVREADGADAREQLRRSPAVLRRLNSGALHLAEAVAAGRHGRTVPARVHLAAGEADLTGHDWWAGLLRLLVLEAAAQDGWLDPVPALRAELARHEQTGEPELARTSRDLLRVCGAPVHHTRRGTVVPPHLARLGVTSREVDVLELVVRGLTNREIAERLRLSPRTVDTHVARLLAKTGAADRRGLSVRTTQHR